MLFFFLIYQKCPSLAFTGYKPSDIRKGEVPCLHYPCPCLPESCYGLTKHRQSNLQTSTFITSFSGPQDTLSFPQLTSFTCTHISLLLSRQNRQHILSTLTDIYTFAKNTSRFKSIYLLSMHSYKKICGTHYAPNRSAWPRRIQSVIHIKSWTACCC